MKSIIKNSGFVVMLIWALTSCNNEKKQNDLAENKPDLNEAAKDTNNKKFDKPTETDAKFEKASTTCNDEDIKTWASSMLPALHTHLDHSQKCEEMVKKM